MILLQFIYFIGINTYFVISLTTFIALKRPDYNGVSITLVKGGLGHNLKEMALGHGFQTLVNGRNALFDDFNNAYGQILRTMF